MALKDILLEINSLPQVGGSILCTLNGKIVAQDLPSFNNEYQRGSFSSIILNIFHKFDETGGDFVDMLHSDSGNTWIAVKYRGIILIVLLYPKADMYFVKLQLNLVVKKLWDEKEVKKISSKESAILITTIDQVRILDVLQFHDHTRREGFTKGIMLTQKPYNARVNDELQKPNTRIEVIITDDTKAKRKSLTKEYEKQGFTVKYKTFITDRGM
ncbi:hypothetical protein ACFL2O_03780 [Thermodesulfobacteriota bacterium]